MRKLKFWQLACGLGILGVAGLAAAEAGFGEGGRNPEGRAVQPETLRGVGTFALHAPPRALGPVERGEARYTLDAEDLQNMRISSPRSFGEAFAVSDLRQVSEVGLVIGSAAGRVEGRVKTALGGLSFRSAVQPDGQVRVEFDLGHAVVGMLIDDSELVATPLYDATTELAPADKFAFHALSVLLAKQGPQATREGDFLVRTVNLWSELVPVGPTRAFFRDQVITPEGDRGWTTLCGRTSASLCHDAASHGNQCFTVGVGPSAYRCRARCGSGCDAYIGTSAWTIDCGEHDHCLEAHYNGECFYCGDCGDEANSAQDDFLFAGNCNY